MLCLKFLIHNIKLIYFQKFSLPTKRGINVHIFFKVQGISYCNLEILKLKYLFEFRKQLYPWKKVYFFLVLLQSRERFTVNWFGRQNMMVVRRKICGWPVLWNKIPKLWSFRFTPSPWLMLLVVLGKNCVNGISC